MTVAKISPRQKMINMMYLILTAMLALNVSAEILKAFFLMETSMDQTGVNIDKKNDEILVAFDKHLETQPDITRPFYVKAKEAERLSKEFIQHVENLKNILITETGGREESENGDKTELVGRDNMDIHAGILINQKKGRELLEKINTTRVKMLELLPEEDRSKVLSDLEAHDYETQSWESFHFEHSPLAAVVAMMSKIQNDCKNTTYDVLKLLYGHVGSDLLPIDKIEAAIIPQSSYLMAGDQFKADIFLTAFSTRQTHEIYIEGEKVGEENGKFTYQVPSSGPGTHTVKGEIWVRESDSLRKYPFQTSYNVFKGGASISADNTKILYKGIDNPLTITVPGVAPSNVRAEMTAGNLVRVADGKYNAKLSLTGKIKVRVSIKDDYGNWKSMGEEEFLVRNAPQPSLSFGALNGSRTYTKAALQAQNMLVAGTGGIYIKGMQYTVKSFNMTIVHPRNGLQPVVRVNGQALSPEAKQAINSMAPGSIVIFDNIKVENYSDPIPVLTLFTNR